MKEYLKNVKIESAKLRKETLELDRIMLYTHHIGIHHGAELGEMFNIDVGNKIQAVLDSMESYTKLLEKFPDQTNE